MKLEVAAKRMQLLKESFPQVVRVAVWMQKNIPDAKPELDQVTLAARQLGVQLRVFELIDLRDLERAARESRQWSAQAVYVASMPIGTKYRREIAAIIAELRVPAIYPTLEQVAGAACNQLLARLAKN